MNLATIEMERPKAREAFLEYRRAVRERHDDEDRAIMRGYRELAAGRQLLKLSETIVAGGALERTFVTRNWRHEVVDRQTHAVPRLAVVRADAQLVFTGGIEANGAVEFQSRLFLSPRNRKDRVTLAAGTFAEPEHPGSRIEEWAQGAWRAIVPIIPPPLRPRHSLAGYHVLFEAEWSRSSPAAPVDPALLKHLGGDLYAVVAVWDLTELERAVLAGRRPE